MTPLDLLRELARPAEHDHRRLSTDQRIAENIARVAVKTTFLAFYAAGQGAVHVANAARTAHVATHLLRNR